MPTDKIFGLLSLAPYGVYAVDLSQSIVFWNRSAERILGHKSATVIGLKCYEVCQSLPHDGSTPVCLEGCPAIRLAREGAVPPVVRVRILCASGLRKPVTITPLIIPLDEPDGPVLLVHLLHESVDDARAKEVAEDVLDALAEETPLSNAQRSSTSELARGEALELTNREVEVLRLVALSLDTGQIAEELHLSAHTVLNHIRHARVKLDAPNRLGAVLAAQRRGLI